MHRNDQPAQEPITRSPALGLPVARSTWDTRRRPIPNAISWLRIALCPVPIVGAIAGWTPIYWVWLVVAAVSDSADGVLARRWKAVSDRGRQLDSWGDLVSLCGGLIGATLLWPDHWDRQRDWLTVLILSHLVPAIFGLIRHGGLLGYHSRLARLSSYAIWPGAALMIGDITPGLFHVAVGLEFLVAIEYVTIWHLCRTHRGEISSVFAAIRIRHRASTTFDRIARRRRPVLDRDPEDGTTMIDPGSRRRSSSRGWSAWCSPRLPG